MYLVTAAPSIGGFSNLFKETTPAVPRKEMQCSNNDVINSCRLKIQPNLKTVCHFKLSCFVIFHSIYFFHCSFKLIILSI